jgi:UDP-N-acetylmuramyl pentapeptide phosphotransferase/UDP-N-acetylglucosamine-1-phosphate transferase
MFVIVVLPALVAFVVAWWLTGRLCSPKSLSILAHPNDRTLHAMPTPQTGGVAVIASVVIALVATASLLAITQPVKPLLPKGFGSGSLWIVVSMLLVFVVSFIDDCRGLPASLRLGVQAAAALIIVVGVGLTLSSIPIPGGPTILLGIAAIPVSVLVLLWMANLYNFMDGMDGFSGGMTAIGFGFLAYFGWVAGSPVMLMIAVFVAMSALGFLVHNFPPARIFMGDAGSITVGFVAGTLILLGVRDEIFELWVPIILFSPFILDATITLIRRALRFEKIWMAHRQHYYQRIVLSGWSHRRTVLAEYGVMTACGGIAVLYHHAPEKWRLLILGVWLVMFLLLAMFVHRLERKKAISCPVPGPNVTSGKKRAQTMPVQNPPRATVKT